MIKLSLHVNDCDNRMDFGTSFQKLKMFKHQNQVKYYVLEKWYIDRISPANTNDIALKGSWTFQLIW